MILEFDENLFCLNNGKGFFSDLKKIIFTWLTKKINDFILKENLGLTLVLRYGKW